MHPRGDQDAARCRFGPHGQESHGINPDRPDPFQLARINFQYSPRRYEAVDAAGKLLDLAGWKEKEGQALGDEAKSHENENDSSANVS